MTSYRRAKRIACCRGSAITLLLCTTWMLASAYADTLTH